MTLSGHWSVPDYSATTFKWDIAPIPQGPAGRVTTVNAAGFVASAATAHPDAVWEFLKFVTSEEGQSLAATIGLAVPIRETVALSPVYLDQSSAKIDHKLFVDALTYARRLPSFRGYDEWSTAVGDALHSVWAGEISLTDGLTEASAAGDDALSRNK